MERKFKPCPKYYEEISFEDTRYCGLSPKTFLVKLASDFRIKSIYYPGSGNDFTLSRVFSPEGITYLDCSERYERRFKNKNHVGKFVLGDMNNSFLPNNQFDAAYIQDIHPNDKELVDILRVLRPKGLLIFSLDDCIEGDLEDLETLRQQACLRELKFSRYSAMFHVFQKTARVEFTPEPAGPHPEGIYKRHQSTTPSRHRFA